ncbi:MAG: imidazole glycerol phosphate synthase subunit HisH [Magnetococcus sp. WYHC-3]
MIVVVDYGSGNLRSVSKAVASLGGEVEVSGDPARLALADHLILPGVGAFADCRHNLDAAGLTAPVLGHIRAGKPFLGICVGMQMLFDESHEFGRHPGLGLVRGCVEPFDRHMPDPADPRGQLSLKVPHMGWNRVRRTRPHPLWHGIDDASHFYFVHSFHGVCQHQDDAAGFADYGVTFTAAVARDNLFATQFHPEKSQRAGLQLLSNFIHWKP